MKTLKIILFLFILFASAFLVLGYALTHVFIEKYPLYIFSAVGAFMSALATSCLAVIGWFVSKIIGRFNRGYDALVKSQPLQNEYQLMISDNAALLGKYGWVQGWSPWKTKLNSKTYSTSSGYRLSPV
ncbi:MAG: hypothetical protein ACT4O3_02860 [Elusimicrobiota bacterium]|jgi:CBS domain containing-hemolysin-like protein